jgi:hypothetical protein
VVRGNTQFTPAGGDLFPDLMASLTERNWPAVTDVRARTEVGPTRSYWRVTHGCCMGIASGRANRNTCFLPRINGQDCINVKIERSRIENRCEEAMGVQQLYL